MSYRILLVTLLVLSHALASPQSSSGSQAERKADHERLMGLVKLFAEGPDPFNERFWSESGKLAKLAGPRILHSVFRWARMNSEEAAGLVFIPLERSASTIRFEIVEPPYTQARA